MACSHSASGSTSAPETTGNSSDTSENNVATETDGIRGQKGDGYQVGDIVLNDGSFLREVTRISNDDKAKAIAVIYKVDGTKAYGVGLVHNVDGLAWCLKTANGYNTRFRELECKVTENDGELSITGDTDVSDNFEKIGEALIAAGKTDDTGIEGNYPSFEFVKNYKNQPNSHVSGTEYEDGWYLPTLSELYDIYKVKDTVDSKNPLCVGSQFYSFNYDVYWSSSQKPYTFDGETAYFLDFNDDVYFGRYFKFGGCSVCCIRIFD